MEGKKIYHANNDKKSGFLSDKLDCNTKIVTGDKGQYILMKGLIPQKTTIVNIYVPKNRGLHFLDFSSGF